MVAWETGVSGACEYDAFEDDALLRERVQMGVKPRFEPRKPMRSARTVSMVITITLGLSVAAAARDGRE